MKRVGGERPIVIRGAEPVAPGAGPTATGAPAPLATPLGPSQVPTGARTAATIPPRVVSLPEGWPATFDLGKAAQGVCEVLAAQGKDDPGTASSIVFTDADLTFFEAPALPTYLLDKKTGAVLLDPDDGKPVRLGMGPDRHAKTDLLAFAAKHPHIDTWQYVMDNREFDSVANILAAAPIEKTIDALRSRKDGTRQFVITARGSTDDVTHALGAYLAKREVPMDGVFMMFHVDQQTKLGIEPHAPDAPQRKALTMAAILHRYDPSMTTLQRVRFVDDHDGNLRAAMQLLPALFPHIKFQFVDVIHEGGGQYRHHTVARSSKDGGLRDAAGQQLSAEQIATYKSVDAPFSPSVAPIEFWKADAPFGELANFAAFPVEIGGKTWPTTEHYFQAQKFVGTPHEDEIRAAATPALAAALGRDKTKPLRADWEQVKEAVMRTALDAKFSQHPELGALLRATGEALLTEASPKDGYWGTGADGRGKNRLGELLMQVRAELPGG